MAITVVGAVLLASGTARAAITRVQFDDDVGTVTGNPTWPMATTAGNLLIAVISFRGGSNVTITPPSLASPWTLANRKNSGTDTGVAIYYIANAASQSGASNWTTSGGGTNSVVTAIFEYSGAETSSVFDTYADNIGTGTSAITGTANANTVVANELVIAAFTTSSTNTWSGPSTEVGERSETGGGNLDTSFREKFVTSTGSQSDSATLSASAAWSSVMATFKEAAAGGSGATIIWGGGNGTFGTAANWIGGVAPGSSDIASFGPWWILPTTGWTATSSNGNNQTNAFDGRRSTRWNTGANQSNGMWFRVDMGTATTFSQIDLDATTNPNDYPRGWILAVSNDDSTYTNVTSGSGTTALLTITFTAQTARYIKITQTGSSGVNWWSIGEMTVYGSASGWVPLPVSGWTATASKNNGTASVALDNDWSTRWNTGNNRQVNDWFKVDMGTSRTFDRIQMDSTGQSNDYPDGYSVDVSTDNSSWTTVATGTGASPSTDIITTQTARYIRITLTTSVQAHWWSIYEFRVYTATTVTQLARNGWTASASASDGSAPASNSIDGDTSTRWATGANQTNGQWFKVDMTQSLTVSALTMDSYSSTSTEAVTWKLELSTDNSSYTTVAVGKPGSAEFMQFTFPAQAARYIKITQTGSSGSNWWSIHEFNAFGSVPSSTISSAATVGGISLNENINLTQAAGATLTNTGNFNQSAGTFTAGNSAITIAGNVTLSGGTYVVGSGTQTISGNVAVQAGATITMATSGGTLSLASGKTLTMDGTLNASSTGAAIKATSGTFTFSVGSTSSSTPTLNITGLAVQNTDTSGMNINVNHSASTTFTRFDNIAFTNGAGTGAGNYFLQIYATSLYLTSNGCSFDGGATATVASNVKLGGNGTSDGETRALFGNATCASNKSSCEAYDADDDNNATPDGIGDSANTDGAVIQWITSALADTSGSIEGFPTAAFDWNSFTYYSTYVAYHDVGGGTADRVYVRSTNGSANYSWDTPSGVDIIGATRWETVGNTHYVYVATTSGKVYRLIDNGSNSLAPDTASPWNGANNPFDCGCTIATPLAQDASNLYFGGSVSGTYKLWTVNKTSTTRQPTGSPLATGATTSNAAPAIWTSGDTYSFLGQAGRVTKIDVTTQSIGVDNVNPGGSNAVTGRISVINGAVYAGDDNGYMWSLDPGMNFAASTGTYKNWGYHDATNHAACGGVCQVKSHYVDPQYTRVYYGDQDGHLYVIGGGSAVTGYPWRPGTSSDPFATAPLYRNGVIVIGATDGFLYVIDQNSNGSVPALIQTYKFGGSSTAVSGAAFDSNSNSYMISTANATNKDGRLHYIPASTDPSPSFL